MSNSNLTELLRIATELAKFAHQFQFDKAQVPYINHVFYVRDAMNTLEGKIVGVLHDAIKDSPPTLLTLNDLKTRGFPDRLISAIDSITKRTNESYGSYLQRVCKDPIALEVKIEDVKHNSSLTRIQYPTPSDICRMRRHYKTLKKLQRTKDKKMIDNRYLSFVRESSNYFHYTPIENLLRASIGLTAEYREYLSTPNLDELGDCVFWWSLLIDHLAVDVQKVVTCTKPEFDPDLFLDCVEKKTRVYRARLSVARAEEINNKIANQLQNFYRQHIITSVFPLDAIRTHNRLKLEKRLENRGISC